MTRENWQKALAEVEEGVRACLAALDRYEATFEGLLSQSAPAAKPPATADGWDASLALAADETNRVEYLLAEQEVAWGRWHDALDRWGQSLEQKKN